MPAPEQNLTTDLVREYIAGRCFSRTSGTSYGVEVEFLSIPIDPRRARVDVVTLSDLLDEPLPGGSVVTFEPGGQVELSSMPRTDIGSVSMAVASDLALVGERLRDAGIRLVGLGLDPTRAPQRVTSDPRYAAMEVYFDATSPGGRMMMANTAAIHANIQLDGGAIRRWQLAHRLGPVLLASFANSPLGPDGPTGCKSSRSETWTHIDRGRSGPVDDGSDPADAWTRYALAANVMLIRTSYGAVPMTGAFPLSSWIDDGHALGFPTLDDVEYHLTTLFPPVRPRGRLELRMIDALPDPWWRAASAVAWALLADDEAAEAANRATETAVGCWTEAARGGLAHPGLAAAADACFAAARPALDRLGADADTRAAVDAYHDRYIRRGRTPADDRLDAWETDGSMLPDDQPVEAA